MRDPIYRLLRAHVQALLDRDAPKAYVLIEVDWESEVENPSTNEAKVVCIARCDDDRSYTVWTVGFTMTSPDSLDHGRYGIPLEAAAAEMSYRLGRG